ncbi:RNA polymerase sigma-70 factor [Pedobacter sp.]|jgi:RNA polymerase sigma-70 factor (family 1)|uniref:RNA polymerase sigma-70 factor n=1 Tax=Pedobacter sp. TaxID=1411316 RepID=UPI002BE7CEC3|nr:RNA polymerase sigma-70 factor [Pedobacter sp.]HWW42006.1 RNA polymerase sigma-70 factor [Pedobacter sp.]
MASYGEYTDQELIALLKQGDREAFNQIYHRYAEYLYQYALNILRDEDECTDAVQDVFVWLWENGKKINVTVLRSYLISAVKYKLTRVIQSSKRRAEILALNPLREESFVDDNLEIKELKHAIQEFVVSLPERARLIFEMSRNEYLSNKEIAARLGISEKTVENQMTIVLKKLKSGLGKMSFWTVLV